MRSRDCTRKMESCKNNSPINGEKIPKTCIHWRHYSARVNYSLFTPLLLSSLILPFSAINIFYSLSSFHSTTINHFQEVVLLAIHNNPLDSSDNLHFGYLESLYHLPTNGLSFTTI